MNNERKIGKVGNVVIRYSPDYKEFRVRVTGRPSSDYFTNDRTDAFETARLMDVESKSYARRTQVSA